MSRSLPAIPVNEVITDMKGRITTFFRLRWQQLSDGYQDSASLAQYANELPLAAALPATSVITILNAGRYRVSYYLRKTQVDGVSSSAQVSFAWIDKDGQALSYTFAALTLDALGAVQSDTKIVRSINSSDITVAVAYASNTPGGMHYDLEVVVEYLP